MRLSTLFYVLFLHFPQFLCHAPHRNQFKAVEGPLFIFFVIIGAWETIDLLQEFYDGKFSKYTYVFTVVLVSVFDL